MQLYSVLALLFIACSIQALPTDIEFEVRDNIELARDVEIRELVTEIRADMQMRDLIVSRGDVDKAGSILDKVNMALTPISAAGPVGIAATVVKTAVKVFSAVLQAIGKAQHSDALKRGAFTQDVVDKTLQKHPGWNCVVVHTQHTKNFKGTEGKDWAHEHQELHLKFPVGSTIGFEIYTFREGTFELLGDGGFQNWAFGGQFKRNGKKVTFTASKAAKGSAKDAAAGSGKEAAKESGKIAKQQEKKEKKGAQVAHGPRL